MKIKPTTVVTEVERDNNQYEREETRRGSAAMVVWYQIDPSKTRISSRRNVVPGSSAIELEESFQTAQAGE